MPTPNDRRIIFSNQVISKEEYTTTDLEETTEEAYNVGRADYTKYKIDTNVNKKLGGKGIATIKPAQWNDGWSSMFHDKAHWDLLRDDVDNLGNRWEDEYTCWNGTLFIGGSGIDLTQNLADPNSLGFLYVKNLGDTNPVYIWLNDDTRDGTITFGGRSGETFNGDTRTFREDYKIKVSPGASVCFRGNGQDCDDVQMSTDAYGSHIEYLIALEAT